MKILEKKFNNKLFKVSNSNYYYYNEFPINN